MFPGRDAGDRDVEGERRARSSFRCKVKERDEVVITNAAVELYTEIPKPKAKAAAPPRRPQGAAAGAERRRSAPTSSRRSART